MPCPPEVVGKAEFRFAEVLEQGQASAVELGWPPRGGRSHGVAPFGGGEDSRHRPSPSPPPRACPSSLPNGHVGEPIIVINRGFAIPSAHRSKPDPRGRARRHAGSLEALRGTRPEAVAS